jgi:hypothetical protein
MLQISGFSIMPDIGELIEGFFGLIIVIILLIVFAPAILTISPGIFGIIGVIVLVAVVILFALALISQFF